VSNRPSLGLSASSPTEFGTGKFDVLRRIGFLLVALVVMGAVFFYLTRAVQTSTAHATSDDSPLHYDPNAAH
jgi:hypothetical protein